MRKFNSEYEVLEEMAKYKDSLIKDIIKSKKYLVNKSFVGVIVEKEIFDISQNSKPVPDIENLGIEIKTTPIKKVKNKYVSKERLVLNVIDYIGEDWNDIFRSSFWIKNQKILIIFYEYIKDINPLEFKIKDSIIYNYPDIDFKIIKNDWNIISNKVKEGKAHELSERDTLYLAACTKGANKNSLRRQPYSKILAKQRAYSLKPSYMTTVYNEYVLNKKKDERIINDINSVSDSFDFQEFIVSLFKPYFGKSTSELQNILNLNSNSKSINSLIVKRILGIKNKLEDIYEFKKAGIIPKTIRIENGGKIKESMSFPTFKFNEIIDTKWEDSDIYNTLVYQKFLFIIFKKSNKNEDYILMDIKFWTIPDEDLEQCRLVYEKTKEIINEGIIIIEKGNKSINNLPSQKENNVMHVRPHAQDKDDTYELPDGGELTKQCFWFNRKYIMRIINNEYN